MMDQCVFCGVLNRILPARIVYETDQVFAFEDINPQAPTHILVVPRRHIATLNDITPEDQQLLGAVVFAAIEIARDRQISSSGYRLVWNTNRGAGQSVFHIHLHLLGGRSMAWPPG